VCEKKRSVNEKEGCERRVEVRVKKSVRVEEEKKSGKKKCE
jgi:hypothetical protein